MSITVTTAENIAAHFAGLLIDGSPMCDSPFDAETLFGEEVAYVSAWDIGFDGFAEIVDSYGGGDEPLPYVVDIAYSSNDGCMKVRVYELSEGGETWSMRASWRATLGDRDLFIEEFERVFGESYDPTIHGF